LSDHVSHQYKTKHKIMVQQILLQIFLITTWKTKDSAPNDNKHSLTSICYYLLPQYNFVPLCWFPKIWNLPTFQRSCYQYSYCDFVLHSDLETWSCT
jgi:hypothetical protein